MTQRPALDVRGEIKSMRRRKRRAEIRGALVLARNMAGTITAIHARASTPKKKVVSGSPLVDAIFATLPSVGGEMPDFGAGGRGEYRS
jgi:hypothetical protein